MNDKVSLNRCFMQINEVRMRLQLELRKLSTGVLHTQLNQYAMEQYI